jgi:hypothetical protein
MAKNQQHETASATANKRSRRESDPNLKKQTQSPLDSKEDGVEVVFDSATRLFDIKFPYDRALMRRIWNIPGAELNEATKTWQIPLNQYDALSETLGKMRQEIKHIATDAADIRNHAEQTARKLMQTNGVDVSVNPKISDYRNTNKATLGEIINVNGHFAAQLTGYGQQDGAAFVAIHRLADLDQPLFKGDNVAITYDSKGRGKVAERSKPLTEQLDESMGKYVDGIKVLEQDGKYKIAFDYNPVVQHRLQRIDGVELNRDEKVWEVGTDKKVFVARAVNDMRKEIVADHADREQIEKMANEKIDGAKVKDAFIKDGQSYAGQVLAKNDRYVLQHSGREYAVAHRVSSLTNVPEVGQSVKVTYQQGRGQVVDKSQQKAQGLER